MTLTDNADLGIRCAGCGGNIPGMTMAAGKTYHYECRPKALTPLEKSETELRVTRKALQVAMDGLRDIGESEGTDRRGLVPDKAWHENRARDALAEIRKVLRLPRSRGVNVNVSLVRYVNSPVAPETLLDPAVPWTLNTVWVAKLPTAALMPL